MKSQLPKVTVMIATRNRTMELQKTLASLRRQTFDLIEVIVLDDGSTDGTSTIVASEFPEVRLMSLSKNVGSVQARNLILEKASGDYIIGLDDDSRFVDDDEVSRVVARMEAEPDLAVISFQVIGPENPERMNEEGRLEGEWHCSSYAACGVAIRASVLNQVGHFPGFFFHMYEEPDFVLRVWDKGFRAIQWNEIVVYHEWSGTNRNEQRVHHRHARNEACSIFMRYPWHLVPVAIAYRATSQLVYAFRRGFGWAIREPLIWCDIVRLIPTALKNRDPVKSGTIKICLMLNRVEISDADQAIQFSQFSWTRIIASMHRDNEQRVASGEKREKNKPVTR